MISKIPPFSAKETLDFYATGAIPERFRDSDEARHKEILEPYIHDKPKEKSVYDYLKVGGYIPDEEQER